MPLTFEKPFFLLILLLIPIIWVALNRSFPGKDMRGSRLRLGTVRSITVLLLALALSDPRMLIPSDQVNIFFCMDLSESIDPSLEKKAVGFIEDTLKGMSKDDQAGLIVFGKDPSIERSLTSKYEHPIYRSMVNKNFTDIYSALSLAIGKFPRTGKNRILLFTDGNENRDQSIEMANAAQSLGIEIFSVPLTPQISTDEVYIETLETPSNVLLDTPFEVRLVVTSIGKAKGDLSVQRNNELILNQPIRLEPGKNVIRFSDVLKESGLYRYRADVHTAEDVYFQNNQGISFTHTAKHPAILYVTEYLETSDPTLSALQAQGFHVVRQNPETMPAFIHGLADYNAVVLNNVAADRFYFGAMETLEYYVRDMGGGLVMIGGDKGFGAGHYLKTPIEKALPVFMDVPTDLEFSGVCIILIIDKSHSMVGTTMNTTKLEMAKIAAFSTVELLNPIDSVGILAFDTDFDWVVPVDRIKDRQQIAQKLSTLKEEGGTDLYPALQDALRVLRDYQATKKHIIILSDGQTLEADFQSLVESTRNASITISTVAVGQNANRILMQNIAQWGNGRAYYTENADHIPSIFTDETKIVTKKLIIEKDMHPVLVSQSDLLRGIPLYTVPIIYGQVLTYPKPGSDILFQTSEGPLLITGRYGLGRSVAFTSDLSGRWGKDWVKWEHYGQFVSQMIKWAQKKETHRRFTPSIDGKGGEGIFQVDVMDEQNRFMNNLMLHVQVLFPNETSKEIPLDQIAPGRYRAIFPAEDVGEYYLNLVEKSENGPDVSRIFGFGIPYTEEYAVRDINKDLLNRLVQITGGKLLDIDAPHEELFHTDSETMEYGASFWPYLTVIFLAFLIVDVVIRKFTGPMAKVSQDKVSQDKVSQDKVSQDIAKI